jgi:uncharacterized phage protein gp47/JayE
MAIRTVEEIIQSMVDFITTYNSSENKNIDTRQGTVLKDVVMDAPSQELETTYLDIDYTAKMASPTNASELTSEDLDLLGTNVGLPRKTATYSTGFCDFITSGTTANPPTSDIIIGAGTVVKAPATPNSQEIQFVTTVTNRIYVSNLANYQFIDTDGKVRYKITIPIKSITPGSAGNVSSFTITQLTTPIIGILKIKNTDPTTGGTDLESNESYGARIIEKQSGNNVGTVSGIKSLILEDPRVTNVAVVLPKDPLMIRDPYGGAVDVYILGQDLQPVEDKITFVSGSTGSTITLTKLPAMSLTSVDGTVGTSGYSFNIGTEVEFVKDTTILKDSVREASKIRFLTSTVPDPGSVVTVELVYDKLIKDLQDLIDSDENHIVSSDILIRRSYETLVDIEMNISIFSGFIPLDVATAVNTELVNTINAYNLNDDLNTSDIIAMADGTDGVNSVELLDPTETIAPGKLGYLRVGTTTIHIGSDTFVF